MVDMLFAYCNDIEAYATVDGLLMQMDHVIIHY